MLCLGDFLTSSFSFFFFLLIGDLLGCKEMELGFWRTDSFFFSGSWCLLFRDISLFPVLLSNKMILLLSDISQVSVTEIYSHTVGILL